MDSGRPRPAVVDRFSRLDRLLIGSVSTAVAARAHCTVEVVRQG